VQVRAWIAHQAVTLRVASIAAVARRFNRYESSLRYGVKQYFHAPAL
jgi:transposase-like protein